MSFLININCIDTKGKCYEYQTVSKAGFSFYSDPG